MKLAIVLLFATVCFVNSASVDRRAKTTTVKQTTAKATTTTSSSKTTTTTQHAPAPSTGKCGIPAVAPDTDTNIVGGEDAIPYSWPWQVALFKNSAIFGSFQFCSGTVISNNWILTAGHCFYQETDPTKFTVKLGVFNKADDDEPEEVELGISEFHIHPNYSVHLGVPSWDITLLKLVNPIEFDEDVSPICLPAQNEELPPAGSPTFITGWGDTTEGGTDSPTLEQTSVPVVAQDDCQKDYPQRFYEPTMFCAGLPQGGKDTCQGDSGGPLVYQDSKTGAWRQLGITSWGAGCAEPGHYGVYSKVSAYIDFINQYVTDLP